MKQLFIAITLALLLPIFTLLNGYAVTQRCHALLETLENDSDSDSYVQVIEDEWRQLKRVAAYSSPYDLIRSTNNAMESYLCWLNNAKSSDDASNDCQAARIQFAACLRDLKRIHSLSWEVVF